MFWDVRGRRLFRASLFALFCRIDFLLHCLWASVFPRSLIDSLIFGAPEEQRSVSPLENEIRLIKIMKESVTLAKHIDLVNAKFHCMFSFMVLC